jgi:hypothetical protein
MNCRVIAAMGNIYSAFVAQPTSIRNLIRAIEVLGPHEDISALVRLCSIDDLKRERGLVAKMVYMKEYDVAKMLIEIGAVIEDRELPDVWSTLITRERLEFMKFLFSKNVGLGRWRDHPAGNLLCLAVKTKNKEIVEELLNNSPEIFCTKAVTLAATEFNRPIFDLLLERSGGNFDLSTLLLESKFHEYTRAILERGGSPTRGSCTNSGSLARTYRMICSGSSWGTSAISQIASIRSSTTKSVMITRLIFSIC